MTAFLEWNYRQWEMVPHLEELLRTGRGVDFHRTMTDPADWAVYQRAMLEVARFDVATLAARVPVRRGATRLLDIAGPHGLFGAALCRKHPPMTSTVRSSDGWMPMLTPTGTRAFAPSAYGSASLALIETPSRWAARSHNAWSRADLASGWPRTNDMAGPSASGPAIA